MHVHDNEDEHFIILEGKAVIANGDGRAEVAAGSSITIRSPWRMILLASLGGALELYDFVVFGVFVTAIGAATP